MQVKGQHKRQVRSKVKSALRPKRRDLPATATTPNYLPTTATLPVGRNNTLFFSSNGQRLEHGELKHDDDCNL